MYDNYKIFFPDSHINFLKVNTFISAMKRCNTCGKDAYVVLRSPKMALCKEHFQEYFERRVESTIKRYHMMDNVNKLLVAVSGGKDALALVISLKNLGYDFDCLHINLGIASYSEKSENIAKKQCEILNKKLHVVDLRSLVGKGIGEVRTRRKVCSYCGLTKRYIMNKFAWDMGYDALATGHNLDDEASFIFSNIIHWNVELLARQGPVLGEGKKLVRKIKPLYEISEFMIEKYADIFGIEYQKESCPYSTGAKSIDYKKIINRIEDSSPGTKIGFVRGFLKNRDLFKAEEMELKECKICGMPTTSDICSFCRFWKMNEEIKFRPQ